MGPTSSASWRCSRRAWWRCRSSGGSGSARCSAIWRRGSSSGRSGSGSSPTRRRSCTWPSSAWCSSSSSSGSRCSRRGSGRCAARSSGSGWRRSGSACCCSGPSASRLGYPLAPSLIAGTGFVLTSTAIVMQMLEERGAINQPKGRRIIAILLLEDLAIVPLLALVAFLAPGGEAVTLGAAAGRGGDRARGDRGAGGGGAVAAQPLLPHPRQVAGARGDDGGGAPRRARRGAR